MRPNPSRRLLPLSLLLAAVFVVGACSDPPTQSPPADTGVDTAVGDTGDAGDTGNTGDGAPTDADTTALDVVPDIPGPPPCPCLHGACDAGGGCTCQPGWEGALCETLGDIVVPWSNGPYGVGIMDLAGDFTLPLLGEGDLALSSLWTGEDSVLFILKYGASSYNNDFWQTNVATLFYYAPTNVHIVFGSLDPSYAADMTAMKSRMDAAFSALSGDNQVAWAGRVHYIDVQANALTGAVGTFLQTHGSFMFAIDRMQRWREVGLLWDLTDDSRPIGYVGNEAVYFNYEVRLQWELDGFADLNATVIDIWKEGDRHDGGWGGGHSSRWDIELPDAQAMTAFDSMSIWLYTACPDHKQGKDAGCNEWDYIQTVYVCDQPVGGAAPPSGCVFDGADGPETAACECTNPLGEVVEAQHTCQQDGTFGDCNCGCATEFARYVTSYGREGQWLTPIRQLLPMIAKGGKQTLRFVGANGYDLQGKLFLWNAGTGQRPTKLTYLWGNPGGKGFNLTYNEPDAHPPANFDLPAEVTGVELFAYVSGHGHSSTVNGCSEFCNHQHEFTLNGNVFWLEHPTAGTPYGCLERTHEGGVPNQFGTWQLGRGGWCAGMDVKPFVQGVTPLVQPQGNMLSYRGLFNYQEYDPIITDPGGYLPEIKMTSWLVFYEAM